MSPFYTGYEAGYFRDAGLDLELSRDLPGVQSVPMLAGGKLDVGFVALGPGLVNAITRGARLRVVAAREILSPSCNMHSIYVTSRQFPNGVHDMRQLRHRRIAVASSTPFSLFCLDQLLERDGMTRSDVDIRPMSSNERIPALLAGGVDAMVATSTDLNPMLRPMQLAPGPSLADALPNFQYSHIVFGARLLDGNVRPGALFLHAYFRGARDFLSGRTPAFMDQFAKANDLDPKLVKSGCRDSFEHEGRIRLEDMQMYIDWAKNNGYIPSPVNARNLVDTRFLDAARRLS
jgi:NitT/TauT family transport system substrate-binding protein